MKIKGLLTSVVVLVVAIGGLIFAAGQASDPLEEVEMDGNLMMEEESLQDPASSSGQLIQRAPEAPTMEEDVAAREAANIDELEMMAEEMNEEEGVIVSMSDTGFIREETVIKKGETVFFVNDGQAPHWPASDVHPTHDVLPDFDSERGLQTGEKYSYTFQEVGEWNFHDHLNASLTGVIVVE